MTQDGDYNIDVLMFKLQKLGTSSLFLISPFYKFKKGFSSQYMTLSNLEMGVLTAKGFLCHRNDHWFALRKIRGSYYNLNSLFQHPKKFTSEETVYQYLLSLLTKQKGTVLVIT